MTRHATRDRMDGVLDVDAALLELVGEFADRVLGLGDSQSVPGDDDDLWRRRADGRVVGRVSRIGSCSPVRTGAATRGRAPQAPKITFMTERFIAFAIRKVRIGPEAPTRAPAMTRAWLSSTRPASAAAKPVSELRIGDHDGHVRAADRKHEQSTKRESVAEEDPEKDFRAVCGRGRPTATAITPMQPTTRLTSAGLGKRIGCPISVPAAWRRRP